MSTTSVRRARAFAPGHVTGLFVPDLTARDPRGRGSRGAGLVVEVGAVADASWVPGGPRRLEVVSSEGIPLPISSEVAFRLAPSGPGRLSVNITHALPVGQGFGMSAAGALATGLAVAGLSGATRQRAIEVAHLAELYGGGGLGGVAAILGGGMEVRSVAGVPPFGRVLWRRFPHRVWVGIVGRPIPSPSVLADPRRLRQIRAATAGLDEFIEHPSPQGFLAASERFSDRTRLTTPSVRSVVRALRRCGARSAQAMFGNSFFAVVEDVRSRRRVDAFLRASAVRAVELETALRGARLTGRTGPGTNSSAAQAF